MALDLSRRRFIIGAFASVAGVAAARAIEVATFIPKPKLEWEQMLAFLERALPHCKVEDRMACGAPFLSIKQVQPRLISPPKMFVGWDSMDWDKLTAEGQQESAEFIEWNMRALTRRLDDIAGREESLIRNDHLGIQIHADA